MLKIPDLKISLLLLKMECLFLWYLNLCYQLMDYFSSLFGLKLEGMLEQEV